MTFKAVFVFARFMASLKGKSFKRRVRNPIPTFDF